MAANRWYPVRCDAAGRRICSLQMMVCGIAHVVVVAGIKVPLKPCHGRAEIHLSEVHDQIDGAATACALAPVDELCSGDGQRAMVGVPFGLVADITHSTVKEQHSLQRHGPHCSSTDTPVSRRHDGSRLAFSFGRSETQPFMGKT